MQVLVAELDPTGANLLFSTRIGSGGLDTSNPAGLAVDSAGDIYLAGNTIGPDLITTPGAFQTTASNSALLLPRLCREDRTNPSANPAIRHSREWRDVSCRRPGAGILCAG